MPEYIFQQLGQTPDVLFTEIRLQDATDWGTGEFRAYFGRTRLPPDKNIQAVMSRLRDFEISTTLTRDRQMLITIRAEDKQDSGARYWLTRSAGVQDRIKLEVRFADLQIESAILNGEALELIDNIEESAPQENQIDDTEIQSGSKAISHFNVSNVLLILIAILVGVLIWSGIWR